MSGIVVGPITAFFDFLAGKDDYLALGLEEFRLIDGKVLDLEKDWIPASMPRILTVDRLRAASRSINQTAGQYVVEVEASLSLCYQAEGGAGERSLADIDLALEVIFGLVNGKLAKQSALGAGSIIRRYELALGEFAPMFEIVAGEVSQEVAFWRASLTLRLISERQS